MRTKNLHIVPPHNELQLMYSKNGIKSILKYLYNHSYSIIDELIYENIIKVSKLQGKPISCTKGCYFCCYEQVLAQGIEALSAAAWINDQPRPFKKQVAKKLKKWHQKLKNANINSDLKTHQEIYSSADDYWRANVPCPFLSNDNACSIYKVRPFACRTMLAISSPDKCKSLNNAIIVNCKDFEQYIRMQFSSASNILLQLITDDKQRKILHSVSWFPHLVMQSLE